MKKTKLIVAAVAAMVMGLGTLNAQTTVYLGGVMPLDNYSDGSITNIALTNGNSENGAAAFGFTVGAKYRMPLAKGLSAFVSADFMFNGLRDTITTYNDGDDDQNSNYINVPVMVGLNYEYNLGHAAAIYAEAGLGLNMRFITDFASTTTVAGIAGATTTVNYDPAYTFAWQAGAGIKLQGKYSIGVNYYALGKADVKGSASVSGNVAGISGSTSSYDYTAGSLNPGLLTIRLGYDF